MHRSIVSISGAGAVSAYFAIAILIGWLSRRQNPSANDYLNASRSLPLWIVVASFLSANCGALEIVGLSAMAAEYGVQAFHFYWIGAIPALIVLALWVMPAYSKSGIRSVPEYLELRFGPAARVLNAALTAVMTQLLASITLYAMAEVLQVILRLSFLQGLLIAASVVLTYVLLGGVRATIYNEAFQLLVILVGLAPLMVQTFRGIAWRRPGDASRWHVWKGMPLVSHHAPFDSIGVIVGLGFVLSFSYWCTDFVQIQRTLAARTDLDARQVPLWAGFGKLLFSLMVVVPGLAAWRLFPALGVRHRFDQTLPLMMSTFYGPALLSVGLTALAATLMSGFAANVSAFASVWTQDIYRSHLRRHETESHYYRMGQASLAVSVAVSVAGVFISFHFGNLMDEVQMIFSLFGVPFFAIFLLGLASRRTTLRGAMWGVGSGTAVAAVYHLCAWRHWFQYGSVMSTNFHVAICAFFTSLAVAWLASRPSQAKPAAELDLLVLKRGDFRQGRHVGRLWTLAASLLLACIALEVLFW